MAYDDFKKRIRDDWRDTLRSILERARSAAKLLELLGQLSTQPQTN